MCVTPYIVKTDDGLVPVPCGKCYECLKQWSNDWRFRLKYELDNSLCSFFLTLTYNDDNLPIGFNHDVCEYQSYLVKKDLQNYFKRLRKNCKELVFRYFAIGEYGGNYNRCHYHVVFFFKSFPFRSKNHLYNFLNANWNKGFIYLKATVKKHINYVSAYFNKVDKSSHLVEPFKLMSKSLGLCFLTAKRIKYFFESFKTAMPNPFGAGYVSLPRYYRKKLDEMTADIVPDNYGFVWSQIAKWKPREYKGLNKLFNDFCQNYDEICKQLSARKCHKSRLDGITYFDLDYDKPVKQFYDYFADNAMFRDALALDRRKLRAAMVQHKCTRLKENYG